MASTSSSSPASVAAMAQQIQRVVARDGWASDQSAAPALQQLLGKLTTLKVDVALLKDTGIGAAVRKLTKHADDVVRGYSASLTRKWMEQVGVPPASAAGRSRPVSREPSPSPSPAGKAADAQRLEHARKRLQDRYATEKAKRDSRTVQVLTRPVAKGRKGTTISAAPSRSSVAQNRLQQQRRAGGATTMTTTATGTPTSRGVAMVRTMPASRPASSSSGGALSREQQHRLRQQKLRALREKNLRENGSLNDVYTSGAGQRPAAAGGRSSSASAGARTAPSSASSAAATAAAARSRAVPADAPVTDRKALLNKMFPRVCGVGADAKGDARKSPTASAGAGAGGAKKKNAAALNEGQREVLAWLKALEVDMSEYAPAFFENGFDSVKLLGNIEKEDLPGLIPKKGHHRLIQQALDDLKRKHRTAAASRSQAAHRDRQAAPKRRGAYSDDDDSDDSFVVSDGDEYRPGMISGMFRKNKGRKRSYSFDSVDSYNMEASYDEIQHEEERSARYGEYEDYREDLRNKNLLKKKKK